MLTTPETERLEPRVVSGTQTARRALAMLRAIVDSDQPLTLAEAAESIGINRSAAYRLVRELEDQALVRQVGDGKRFTAGLGLVALAAKAMSGVDVRSAARPFMDRIGEATSESVSLNLRERRYRVCVDAVDGRLPVRWVIPLGERPPLYYGIAGKVMLAFLPETEREAIMAWAADEGEPVGRIREQLAFAQANGYLYAVGDLVPGVAALAAPIFDLSGVWGSICVSGPSDRWNETAMQAAAPALLDATVQLSKLAGNTEQHVH